MANPLKLLKLKPQGYQFIQELPIQATPKKVWASILDIGKWFVFDAGDGATRKQTLEPWPGGRWIETSSKGTTMLHATVTLIEPERLLRLSGHMGMTHLPVTNVIIFELQPKDGGKTTLLRLGHRAYGFMGPDAKNMHKGGWKQLLPQLKTLAEAKRR